MFGRVRVAALVRLPATALARALKRVALLRDYKLGIDRLATPAKDICPVADALDRVDFKVAGPSAQFAALGIRRTVPAREPVTA